MSRRHSSSSAPAIRRARSAHAADGVRPELPSAALTASAAFFQPMSRLSQVGLPAGTGRFCGKVATPQVYSEDSRPSHGSPELRSLSYQRRDLQKEGVPQSQAPTYSTELSVRPRHFLRGETHDPRGSESGSGPCPDKWPDALPRYGLQGNPVLYFHEPDRGRRGVTLLTLAMVSQTDAVAGEGTAQLPVLY